MPTQENSMSRSSLTAGSGPVRETDLARELGTMDKASRHLAERFSILADRLNPLLRQEPSTEGGLAKDSDKVLVPAANAVRESRLRVDQVIWYIEDVLRRLEV